MLLITFALAAVAPTANPANPAQLRDLRCLAALTSVTESVPEPQRAGVMAGAMYFVGRIEGRDPAIDWARSIVAAVGDEKVFQAALPQELKRCGDEMRTKGEALQRMGETLKQRAEAK